MLAGCSATPTLRTTDTAIEAFEPIRYSAADTCATQKRIAEHNSVYDTLKRGKRVVYAAPCEIEANSGEPDAAAERKVAEARQAGGQAGGNE